jgi:exopolyphosphatase/guanosine-5'-triphosphate,3'-diphosphate pyrophosphatase
VPLVSHPASAGPLAAIDIGSNSFRLEIGRVASGRYRRHDYFKEVVRLGAGLDDQSRLTEAAFERGLSTLEAFAERLQGFEPSRIRAVATQTLREARNRDEFLRAAQRVLGYPIEVISGREEARLIYSGVSFLQPSDASRLVIDIGGRSTELILGRGRTSGAAESFPVGSVSLSMRYFGDGRLTSQAFRAAQIAAGAEFEEALSEFAPTLWTEALGSSGTAGAVSHVLKESGATDGSITAPALAGLIEQCIEAGHVDRLQVPGLRDDRRAVIPGGLAILYTLLTHFGIEQMRPAKGALRQGVIIDLHERLLALRAGARGQDVRDLTVSALQARFGVDLAQAERVRDTALSLHDAVLPDADLQARRELAWACDLHELGLAVSHHDYHRHSAYLMAHLDAPGFSQSQQRRIGQLVLAQRGGLRKVEEQLADPLFAWQTLCLRLAVIRCHARQAEPSPAYRLARRNGRVGVLGWVPPQVTPNPRALHLLQEEMQAWERQGPLRLEFAQ